MHTHLARRKSFCRFHRNTAISATPAFAARQHSANPRDGNRIPLNFNRQSDEPDMTNCRPFFENENVLFCGPPLQLVRTGLAGVFFPSSQATPVCGGIRIHDLNFEKFP